jgi:hypothetical protein
MVIEKRKCFSKFQIYLKQKTENRKRKEKEKTPSIPGGGSARDK